MALRWGDVRTGASWTSAGRRRWAAAGTVSGALTGWGGRDGPRRSNHAPRCGRAGPRGGRAHAAGDVVNGLVTAPSFRQGPAALRRCGTRVAAGPASNGRVHVRACGLRSADTLLPTGRIVTVRLRRVPQISGSRDRGCRGRGPCDSGTRWRFVTTSIAQPASIGSPGRSARRSVARTTCASFSSTRRNIISRFRPEHSCQHQLARVQGEEAELAFVLGHEIATRRRAGRGAAGSMVSRDGRNATIPTVVLDDAALDLVRLRYGRRREGCGRALSGADRPRL
jgi:hypothetical protein